MRYRSLLFALPVLGAESTYPLQESPTPTGGGLLDVVIWVSTAFVIIAAFIIVGMRDSRRDRHQ